MNKINQLTSIVILMVLAACGGQTEDANPNLTQKKSRLDSLKGVFMILKAEIDNLEDEVAELDPDLRSNDILVSTVVPGIQEFQHIVQFRGSVMSRKNVVLSAESMGIAQSVKVREGDNVQKGQLLVTLDSEIIKSNIEEINTQLELSKLIYEKQERLWSKKIGTEIRFLESKANYEGLASRKATLDAQLRQARVTAPFSGTIDFVNVRVGEMVQPSTPLMRLVNSNEMHIMADVSEEYIGKFKAGKEVTIEFPGNDEMYQSTVRSVGNVLNNLNRTFVLEVSLPKSSDFQYKPNQIAVINIADYQKLDAVVVPSKVILSGKDGQFLYTVNVENGKKIARKMKVNVGQSAKNTSEIVSGLKGTEEVITEGYRDVSDGAQIRVSKEVATK